MGSKAGSTSGTYGNDETGSSCGRTSHAAAAPLRPEAPWRGPGSRLPLGSRRSASLVAIPHSGWMQGLWLDRGAAGRPCWGLKTGSLGSDVACVVTLDGAWHVLYLREGDAT